jgi:hypothetical protein
MKKNGKIILFLAAFAILGFMMVKNGLAENERTISGHANIHIETVRLINLQNITALGKLFFEGSTEQGNKFYGIGSIIFQTRPSWNGIIESNVIGKVIIKTAQGVRELKVIGKLADVNIVHISTNAEENKRIEGTAQISLAEKDIEYEGFLSLHRTDCWYCGWGKE